LKSTNFGKQQQRKQISAQTCTNLQVIHKKQTMTNLTNNYILLFHYFNLLNNENDVDNYYSAYSLNCRQMYLCTVCVYTYCRLQRSRKFAVVNSVAKSTV